MALSVRRLYLDATLGRYWRIGLAVRSVWIGWMDLRIGGISCIAEARETDSPAAVHRDPDRARIHPFLQS
ncbi:hypothetical protein SBC1_20160 [Caballeronia sp. SBC1]|nr:hypothetical protein SBC2_21540 [Caballeronia sp. SBC2]QIN62021.1 hypothetical protein SBC1_20160 [Caballeronia sp. SBC1]